MMSWRDSRAVRWVSTHQALLLPLLLFAAAFRVLGVPHTPGLDPSYRLAFNLFFSGGAGQAGGGALFNLGPLAFAMFPLPIGHNMLAGNLIALTIQAAAALCFSRLVLAPLWGSPRAWHRVLNLALALLSFNLLIQLHLCFSLVAMTIIGSVMWERTGRGGFLIYPVLCPAAALLLKPAFALQAMVFVLSFGLIRAILDRRPGYLWRVPPVTLAAAAAFWIAAGGSLPGLMTFLRATWELFVGNSSAMSLSAPYAWYSILVAAAMLLAAAKLRLVQPRLLLALVPTCLPWIKYALSRIDHAPQVNQIFAVVLIILVFHQRRLRRRLTMAALAVGVLAVLGIGVSSLPQLEDPRLYTTKFLAKALSLSGPSSALGLFGLRDRLLLKSQNILDHLVLKRSTRRRIGRRTVDVYPWEVSYIQANGFRWRPRPVFQSYLAYTPWLDRQNATFLKSRAAPDVLLWEIQKRGGPTRSIDGRYLLSDEPQTMLQIITRYRVAGVSAKVALLERARRPRFEDPVVIGAAAARWGRWIAAPRRPGGILRARVHVARSPYGSLRRALLKEGEVYIHYRLGTGEDRVHRFVPDNAPSGLWIEPYITNRQFRRGRWRLGTDVRSIKLVNRSARSYEPTVRIEWELIRRSRGS